jgi:hypothetical protein
MRGVMHEQPHAERVAELKAEIDETSYTEAALIERDGGEHDPQAAPQHILGVRLEAETKAA